MADRLTRCAACDGRGYFRCECWPGDCICGLDDQDCDECGGEGLIDPSYDDYGSDCDCSNHETDLLEGRARCHRCGRSWTLSNDDIAAEIAHQAAYMADEAEADASISSGDRRMKAAQTNLMKSGSIKRKNSAADAMKPQISPARSAVVLVMVAPLVLRPKRLPHAILTSVVSQAPATPTNIPTGSRD